MTQALTWHERMRLLAEVAAAREAEMDARRRFVQAVKAASDAGLSRTAIAKHAGFTGGEASVRMLLKREHSRLATG